MQRRQLLKQLAAAIPALAVSPYLFAAAEPREQFSPDWNSLARYRTPDWFRNAKFGIWAHWGPQCAPEYGDWYARAMYEQGSEAYQHHLQHYGHPSQHGFKDIIANWRADAWQPDELLALYRRAGARYFVALANHHDNFDLYNSRYQPEWNSTRIGPRKDLIGGWRDAARRQGMRFGVSVHAAHAWTWYEVAQGADRHGPLAGVPYDGRLQRADGAGKWWQGLDPQGLYAQNHPLSAPAQQSGIWDEQWHWRGGVALPSAEYVEQFRARVMDLVQNYDPDLVYFDDTVLPLHPVSDVGLRLAADIYNLSIARKGRLEAVVNGKLLDAQQRQCMVLDIERGQSNEIEALPWQTCTCIGNWHYDRRIYDANGYRSARTVVHMLIDVVSKNGNLLLSVPVRGNGSIDERERAVVEEIGQWMAMYGSAIYDTRPWRVAGEGPVLEAAASQSKQGFNEGQGIAFSSADVRYTCKENDLYAFVMGWPAQGTVLLRQLRRGVLPVRQVALHGSASPLAFKQQDDGLLVHLPSDRPALPYAFALKISA